MTGKVEIGNYVRVTWEDVAKYDETTIKAVERDEPLIFESFGQVIAQNDSALFICGTMPTDSTDTELRDILRLPRRVIDSIVLLEEARQ